LRLPSPNYSLHTDESMLQPIATQCTSGGDCSIHMVLPFDFAIREKNFPAPLTLLLGLLAFAGRMTPTNYILQSIVCKLFLSCACAICTYSVVAPYISLYI
jgi:hypothetical protein